MTRLLLNTPSGAQEIIEVGDGGGYFDRARVLWDEREDGVIPEIVLGGMLRQDGSLIFNQLRMDEHNLAIASKIPQVITMRQARLALLSEGVLATVNEVVAGLAGPQGDAARIEWEFSSEVYRHRPIVLAIAQILGWNDAKLDSLFVKAATL